MDIEKLAERCMVAESCLPDAPYRTQLCKLHQEMLDQIARLRAEVESLKDPGYVRVPVEPTIGMIAALEFNGDIDLAIGHAQICEEIKERYRAMLTAATGESHD